MHCYLLTMLQLPPLTRGGGRGGRGRRGIKQKEALGGKKKTRTSKVGSPINFFPSSAFVSSDVFLKMCNCVVLIKTTRFNLRNTAYHKSCKYSSFFLQVIPSFCDNLALTCQLVICHKQFTLQLVHLLTAYEVSNNFGLWGNFVTHCVNSLTCKWSCVLQMTFWDFSTFSASSLLNPKELATHTPLGGTRCHRKCTVTFPFSGKTVLITYLTVKRMRL